MKKEDSLEQITTSVFALLNTNSIKQLEVTIVESAKKLSEATYGQLFLNTHDRLKNVYNSSVAIKKVALIKIPAFKEALQASTITYLPHKVIKNWQLKNLPEEIRSIAVVPLFHKDASGTLLLYRTTNTLTPSERKKLQLFSQIAVLALTKARLQDESQKALEIRDRFISLASHELRTPLTSLHGYIQLLHAKMIHNKSVEARWVKELYIESIRLTTLVKELLDVNRIKQGQFAFVFNEIFMRDVVTRAMEHHRLTQVDHPVLFQNKMNKNTKVVGDFNKLVEMVSGLLGNAVKFSTPQEKILVSLKNNQGMLSLVVKDTGRGISKKDLAAIFDGFYKSAHASHFEGMGVGLLLAKHIVENHRGKIKITSKENKGTKVEILLPTLKTSPN